ncbi:ABC transporter ATP-binding protein [Catalinimonas niigatensis]|uniref:ABC transporter ATP-binding protein n=1 Tax=Catalinimonas niigatensis TaxID=1397264 RepID=UPI002666BE83|nr:ABC transporter ATP-binding protein [Catalinimonas niigatensis]WPP53681.1 ABC transporter ATP-binding protein [Catalinimonas niigatensis]
MQIKVNNLGKKFQKEWVFRNVNLTLVQGEPYVLIGPNGSGKSTLMLILSGLLPPSQGEVSYHKEGKEIPEDQFYLYQSIVAPYEEVVEEFTLEELLDFHFSFKKADENKSIGDIMESLYLTQARHKYIRQFSSGMKQRLKLGLAFYAQSDILFLDEPCSNLDAKGIEWYQQEVRKVQHDRIVVVCSNQPYEYEFVKHQINIEQYK